MLLPEETKCWATKSTVLMAVSFPCHLSTGMHSGPPQNQKSPRGTGDHRTAQ